MLARFKKKKGTSRRAWKAEGGRGNQTPKRVCRPHTKKGGKKSRTARCGGAVKDDGKNVLGKKERESPRPVRTGRETTQKPSQEPKFFLRSGLEKQPGTFLLSFRGGAAGSTWRGGKCKSLKGVQIPPPIRADQEKNRNSVLPEKDEPGKRRTFEGDKSEKKGTPLKKKTRENKGVIREIGTRGGKVRNWELMGRTMFPGM